MYPGFNRLRVFYYIFQYNSVAKASKKLNITQSAVSQHLQKLETELKTHLFTRLHKQLVPTHSGQKLFNIVKPFIEELKAGIKMIHKESKELYGTLRLGTPVEFGERYIPGILAQFREVNPDVQFFLELGHPSIMLPKLKSGQLDVVIADIYSKKGAFLNDLAVYSIERIFDEELILVCSDAYYGQYVRSDQFNIDMQHYHYVAYQKHAPALQSWFQHHYNRQSVRLNIVMTVESVRSVISGIKQNMGFGVVPSHLIDREIDNGELIQIKTPKKPLINRISLVQLQDKVPTVIEKTFVQFFKGEIAKIVN